MGLAVIYETPDDDTLPVWSFSHAAHHADINRRIMETFGRFVPTFALDPVDPADMSVWLTQHQEMHNAQNAVLGISGQNLLGVEWQDEEQRASWIADNAIEHSQAGAILGIP